MIGLRRVFVVALFFTGFFLGAALFAVLRVFFMARC